MSDLIGRRRRRRADAERSITVILETAVRVLNERPEASIEEIATAAGLTRPTVYAHYRSRQALLDAVIDRITEEHVAALDAADLEHGPPAAALLRVLAVGWQTLERYPLQLRTTTMSQEAGVERDRHHPIQQRLERLARRGQESGDFDRRQPPRWLAAVVIGLGHTAAEQVATGAMSAEEARTALRRGTLRVFGVPPGDIDDPGDVDDPGG